MGLPLMRALLVLVSGPVASGKTTVSRELARRTGLPLIAKDDIKELLGERLPVGSVEESRRLGAASMDVLYHVAEQNLAAGISQIVEALWDPVYAPQRLGRLTRLYRPDVLEVRCRAPRLTLARRARQRVLDGSRHGVHADSARIASMSLTELAAAIAGRSGSAPDVGGRRVVVPTADFGRIDYDRLVRAVRDRLPRAV